MLSLGITSLLINFRDLICSKWYLKQLTFSSLGKKKKKKQFTQVVNIFFITVKERERWQGILVIGALVMNTEGNRNFSHREMDMG